MTIPDPMQLWIVIMVLGLGSFCLRFLFLGLVGNRPLPDWLLRHLRYTAVAVLPAMVVPLALWPGATDGQTEPIRLSAAIVTFAIGFWFKNVFLAMAGGATVLIGLNYWS